MISETELLHVLALQRIPNFGDRSVKKLIKIVGSATAVFQTRKEDLARIHGISLRRLQAIDMPKYLAEAASELDFIKKSNIGYTFYEDAEYPNPLKHCVDGPIVLFFRGRMDWQRQRIISIVGTRKATTYGIHFCERLLEELAVFNPVIVSGFAYGIDITAQKKASRMGLQTIGCLAHGLNQVYPKSHERYQRAIEENGGFITEFWSDVNFDKNNFLKRNRVIAGLSSATIVIESAAKGGSLVTADIAHSYDREVFAVPGRANDPQSEGCNFLIKSQKAQMITSAADLVYALGWDVDAELKNLRQTALFVELEPQEEVIFNYLQGKEKEHMDCIGLDCQIPVHILASILLKMELKGVIQPLPGKFFRCV